MLCGFIPDATKVFSKEDAIEAGRIKTAAQKMMIGMAIRMRAMFLMLCFFILGFDMIIRRYSRQILRCLG